MKLKLDLPIDRWNFVLQKLEPHKKDSETITLFCNAIESLSFEESWPQKIFQCLTSNGKSPKADAVDESLTNSLLFILHKLKF